MKHFGDIKKISGYSVPVVDVVTGGSPCQDLSIAGKRTGLSGERSGLFMEQIRIIKEMRENDRNTGRSGWLVRPRYMVWENVLGALSSNNGEDFRVVLEETAKVADPTAAIPKFDGRWTKSGCIMGNGWSIAWRVFDAQFWGTPQRRVRIALVADFGGQSAPEILFERKGMFRDFEKSQNQKQTNASGTVEGIGNAISFQERAGKPGGGKGILIQKDRTGAITALNHQYAVQPNKATIFEAYQHQGYRGATVSGTLTAHQNDSIRGSTPLVFSCSSFGCYKEGVSTLRRKGGDAGDGSENIVANGSTVRRLTPVECERLQGFPDGWTDIGE